MDARRFLWAWVPVLVGIGVIAFESTEGMGAAHTGDMLANLLQALHLHFAPERIAALNHVLRKCGHFFGYGVLCVLFVRAWLLTLRPALDGRAMMARAIALGILGTALVASADEWHQHFLPGRTGTPRDVALDTAGGIVVSSLASGRLRRIRA